MYNVYMFSIKTTVLTIKSNYWGTQFGLIPPIPNYSYSSWVMPRNTATAVATCTSQPFRKASGTTEGAAPQMAEVNMPLSDVSKMEE